jgi:hypothetical protein
VADGLSSVAVGDLDGDDWQSLADCLTGPVDPPADPACRETDFDGDGDLDLRDWSLFQNAFTG